MELLWNNFSEANIPLSRVMNISISMGVVISLHRQATELAYFVEPNE